MSNEADVKPRSATPGYSGRTLAQKLGIGEGCRLVVIEAPEGYERWIDSVRVSRAEAAGVEVDLVHLFVERAADLRRWLTELRQGLRPEVAVWVSWPKKASKVPTDITEDTIREIALPLGWVDIKVCAVSEIWSGLKLVVRKELREPKGIRK